MLLALDMYLGPTPEIVLVGDPSNADTAAVLRDLRQRFIPNKVVALRSASVTAAIRSASIRSLPARTPRSAEPTLFVCENFACQAPVGGARLHRARSKRWSQPNEARRRHVSAKKAGAVGHDILVDGAREYESELNFISTGLLVGIQPQNPFRATLFKCKTQNRLRSRLHFAYEQPMLLPQLWHR